MKKLFISFLMVKTSLLEHASSKDIYLFVCCEQLTEIGFRDRVQDGSFGGKHPNHLKTNALKKYFWGILLLTSNSEYLHEFIHASIQKKKSMF